MHFFIRKSLLNSVGLLQHSFAFFLLRRLLGGPVLAVLFGLSAAMCTHRDDAWGDSARALGQVALTAQEQALAVYRKHNVVARSQKAASKAWEKARTLERKHHIMHQTTDLLVASWLATRKFVE